MIQANRDLAADDAARPNDQVLHFHAGLPKTATTLLQSRFFPEHEQVDYLGKSVDHRRRFPNPELEQFVGETLRKRVFACDVDLARRLFETQIRPRLGRGKAVVLSMEDGTHGSPRRRRAKMKNLREVCGDCRLLITLRSPLEYVPSMYLQQIKSMNTRDSKRFANPWLPEFEAWLDDRWSRPEKGELSHLDYAGYIADWQETFGQGTVGILVFEQLRRQPQEFFDRLAALLGVRGVDAAAQVAGPPVNPSWTNEQIEKLRRIQSSPLRRWRFRLASVNGRRKLLGAPNGPSARTTLPERWRERISRLTEPGNRELAGSFNLPLAEFGYPV